jgi:hypothetical protein
LKGTISESVGWQQDLVSALFFHNLVGNQILGFSRQQICDQILLSGAVMKGILKQGKELASRCLAKIELALYGEVLKELMIHINVEKFPAENKKLLSFFYR